MTRRQGFGRTWWGRAWVEALEQRAALDPNRLPRGRSYARRGSVLELDTRPGEVRSRVQGSRGRPYDVVLRVRRFSDREWDRVLDAVAASVGRAAALLDGELPPEVVEDAAAAGVSLLPGAGEIQPRCSCPDWADPCKHAAATCYLVADALDADPFDLLVLRGRGRDEVLAGLRARRSGSLPGVESVAAGAAELTARAAYDRPVGAPPVPRMPPEHPGRPTVLPFDPPADAGVTRRDLAALAADATVRAWELARGDGDGGLALDRDEDLARRAADLLGCGDVDALAHAAGLPGRELTAWAIAWRHGGRGGLAAQRTGWTPGPDELADGRTALRALGAGPVRAQANRLTAGSLQLRLGRDGLWYRFQRVGRRWDCAAAPGADPRELVAG